MFLIFRYGLFFDPIAVLTPIELFARLLDNQNGGGRIVPLLYALRAKYKYFTKADLIIFHGIKSRRSNT